MSQNKQYKHYNRLETYEDFVDYCLRRLGAPVIDINLDPEQIQDRISDAIQFYLENDLESVAEAWWIHCVTEDDEKNGYLTIPPDVLDVMEVLTPGSGSAISGDGNSGVSAGAYDFTILENPQYQWFNNFWKYNGMFTGNMNLFYYEISMQYVNMLNTVFTARTEFLYRRRQRKLWMYSKPITTGKLYCLYGTKMLDPETDDCIWDSDFLKAYATCLLGIAWGDNLSKFGNVPSAGGLTINGDAIQQRYMQEKTELEERHKREFQEPAMPMFAN